MFKSGRYLVIANDGVANVIYVSSPMELSFLAYLKCQLLIKNFERIDADTMGSSRKEQIIQYYHITESVKNTALKFGISENTVLRIVDESAR